MDVRRGRSTAHGRTEWGPETAGGPLTSRLRRAERRALHSPVPVFGGREDRALGYDRRPGTPQQAARYRAHGHRYRQAQRAALEEVAARVAPLDDRALLLQFAHLQTGRGLSLTPAIISLLGTLATVGPLSLLADQDRGSMSQTTKLPRTKVRGLQIRQTGGFSPRDIHARGEAYRLAVPRHPAPASRYGAGFEPESRGRGRGFPPRIGVRGRLCAGKTKRGRCKLFSE